MESGTVAGVPFSAAKDYGNFMVCYNCEHKMRNKNTPIIKQITSKPKI